MTITLNELRDSPKSHDKENVPVISSYVIPLAFESRLQQ